MTAGTATGNDGGGPAALSYDPAAQEIRRDPYPTYARLRDEDPVHEGPLGIRILSRDEDVRQVLNSRSFTSDPYAWSLYPEVAEAVYGDPDCPVLVLQRRWMMLRDGAPHTAARQAVARIFEPARLTDTVGYVRRTVAEVARELRQRGGGDLIADIASVVPVKAICHLLGLPYAEGRHCQLLMDRVLLTFGLGAPEPAAVAAANDAAIELQDYFGELIRERRRHPGEDGLSRVVSADFDALELDEWVVNVLLLFAAGHETTINLLGNGMLALLRHPAVLGRVGADASVAASATEEVLRYDAPIQLVSRSATEPVTVAGARLEPGDHVALLLGSANRDPRRFSAPDRFLVDRAEGAALAFGIGAHRCLGARLARAEGAAVFSELAELLAGLRLAPEPLQWAAVSSHRGLTRLAVDYVGDRPIE